MNGPNQPAKMHNKMPASKKHFILHGMWVLQAVDICCCLLQNTGLTWTEQKAAGSRKWRSIALSADGKQLVAVASGDKIYISGGEISISLAQH
jgi:hypothetical protein